MAPKPKGIAAEIAPPRSPQKKNAPRSTSPIAHCLRQNASPQKPKRKPKPKPAVTQDEIAAQIAARIAQLSVTPAVAPQQPSVKVKSIAELRSTKIARLTTKIAVNEAEIARLEREYALAKERLDRETEALEFRKDALVGATGGLAPAPAVVTSEKTKATLAMMDDARVKLEVVADRAQDLLTRFRSGEINERSTMRELKDLLEGAKDGGCDVAGLCRMVAAVDFSSLAADAAGAQQQQQGEAKTARKRKVQDVRAEEIKAREGQVKAKMEGRKDAAAVQETASARDVDGNGHANDAVSNGTGSAANGDDNEA